MPEEYHNPFGSGYVPGTIWWDGLNQRQKLFNETILRGLDLMRATEYERRLIASMINDLHKELVDRLAQADIYRGAMNPGSPAGTYQLKRITNLGRIVDEVIKGGYTQVGQRLDDTLQVVATDEARWVQEAIAAATGEDFLTVGLTEDDLRNLATNTMIAGSHARDWWDKHSFDTQEAFMREVRNGALRGESVQEIARRIRGQPTGKREGYKLKDGSQRYNVEFTGGVLNMKTRHAETLVRTAIQTVSAQTRRDTWMANDDILRGIEQVSTLDTRTTPVCRGYDGGRWDLSGEPIEGTALPYKGGVPRHWNCRSTEIPLTKSWKELGIEGIGETRGVPEGMARASATGLFGADTLGLFPKTFDDWLRSLPPDVQDAIMGKRIMRSYRLPGRIKSVRDLLDQVTGDPLSILELEKRDLLEHKILTERRARRRRERTRAILEGAAHEGRYSPSQYGPAPEGYRGAYGAYDSIDDVASAMYNERGTPEYQAFEEESENLRLELGENSELLSDIEERVAGQARPIADRIDVTHKEFNRLDDLVRRKRLEVKRLDRLDRYLMILSEAYGGIPAEGIFFPPANDPSRIQIYNKLREAGYSDTQAGLYFKFLNKEFEGSVILPGDVRQMSLKLAAAGIEAATAEAEFATLKEYRLDLQDQLAEVRAGIEEDRVRIFNENIRIRKEMAQIRLDQMLWFAPVLAEMTPGEAGINYHFDDVDDEERWMVDHTMEALGPILGSRSHIDQEWNEDLSYWHILEQYNLDHGIPYDVAGPGNDYGLMQGQIEEKWVGPDGQEWRVDELNDQGTVPWIVFTDRDEGMSSSHRGYGAHHWININRNQTDPPTIAHEFGHTFESSNSDVIEYVTAYMKYRAGEDWGSPQDYAGPAKRVYPTEVMGFVEEYAGVIYGYNYDEPEATELLSQGFEEMFKDPIGFYEQDPEYFEVVCDILSGNFRNRGNDYWENFIFQGRGEERKEKREVGDHATLADAVEYADLNGFPIAPTSGAGAAIRYTHGLYAWAALQKQRWNYEVDNGLQEVQHATEQVAHLSDDDFKEFSEVDGRLRDVIQDVTGAPAMGLGPSEGPLALTDEDRLMVQNAINEVFDDPNFRGFLPQITGDPDVDGRGARGDGFTGYEALFPVLFMSTAGFYGENKVDPDRTIFAKDADGSIAGGAVALYKTKWFSRENWARRDNPFEKIGELDTTAHERGLTGVIRHEIGHSLWNNFMQYDAKREFSSLWYDKAFPKTATEVSRVGSVASRQKMKKILSWYGGNNLDEFFAEAFVLLVDPEWPYFSQEVKRDHPELYEIIKAAERAIKNQYTLIGDRRRRDQDAGITSGMYPGGQ